MQFAYFFLSRISRLCTISRNVSRSRGLTCVILYLSLRSFVIVFRVRLAADLARFLPNLEQTAFAEAALERAEFTSLPIVRVRAGREDSDAAAAAGQGVETGAAITHGYVLAGSAGRGRFLLLIFRRGARDYRVGRAAVLVLVAIHNGASKREKNRTRERDSRCVARNVNEGTERWLRKGRRDEGFDFVLHVRTFLLSLHLAFRTLLGFSQPLGETLGQSSHRGRLTK